jgi:ribose/xylose/arabinose/galactoside ABC-type transport system permease subunit
LLLVLLLVALDQALTFHFSNAFFQVQVFVAEVIVLALKLLESLTVLTPHGLDLSSLVVVELSQALLVSLREDLELRSCGFNLVGLLVEAVLQV